MILARDARIKDADRYAKEKMINEEMERNFFAYVTDQAITLHQEKLGSPCQESWQCQATLVCHDSQCSACVSTDECAENRVQSVCVTPEESPALEHNRCLHKSAFPLAWRDWMQIFFCFLVTVIAAPVGIGGGAILVPFFIYFGSFSAHGAIPLSKATILGGAITNTFLNMQRQHPFSNRPLVDWISLVLVLPNLLAGSIFGVLLLAVLPSWIILLAVFCIMTFNSWKVTARATTELREFCRRGQAAKVPEGESLLKKSMQAYGPPPADTSSETVHYSYLGKEELKELVEKESKHDFRALGAICISWIILVTCHVVRSLG